VGGIVGSLLLGVFAQRSINPDGLGGAQGLIYGDAAFFGKQVVAVVAVVVFGFVVSFILAKLVDAVIGLRASEEQERTGLDIALHEEQAYTLSEVA